MFYNILNISYLEPNFFFYLISLYITFFSSLFFPRMTISFTCFFMPRCLDLFRIIPTPSLVISNQSHVCLLTVPRYIWSLSTSFISITLYQHKQSVLTFSHTTFLINSINFHIVITVMFWKHNDHFIFLP